MKLFYNLKIAAKLLVAFSAILILTAFLGIFSIVQLAKVNQTSTDLKTNWMPSVRLLLEMKGNASRYRTLELQHILSLDEADMKKYEKTMADVLVEFQKSSDEYGQLLSEPEEKQIYPEMSQLWTKYLAAHEKIIKLSHENKSEEARAIMRGPSATLVLSFNEKISKLVKANVEGGKQASDFGDNLYANARIWIIGALIGCIALGIILSLWMARLVSRPLNDVLQVAKTVAASDLTSRIEVTSADETGQLLQSLKDMNTSLQNMVGEVRTSTETIATASGQIATGNHDLSSRTEQQASSLEETASSMEEITSTAKQNADNARQANMLVRSASEVAVKGGVVVSQVVDTMNSINASSKKIVDIISVIDGIAFQTNILALNAAVEAARAGEQGRDFAVVATEVRNLAQRSAGAAREIKMLIGDSVEKVDAGSKLVNEAGITMEEIVHSVRRVTDIMGEITSASQEQTAGIEQINQAISQMDTVTQQNAGLVEEAAAAAQSMQDQAGSLAQVVSVFKLDADASKAAIPAVSRQRPASTHAPVKQASRNEQIAGITAATIGRARKNASATVAAGAEWEEF